MHAPCHSVDSSSPLFHTATEAYTIRFRKECQPTCRSYHALDFDGRVNRRLSAGPLCMYETYTSVFPKLNTNVRLMEMTTSKIERSTDPDGRVLRTSTATITILPISYGIECLKYDHVQRMSFHAYRQIHMTVLASVVIQQQYWWFYHSETWHNSSECIKI